METDFYLSGISVSDSLEAGIIITASPWVEAIASENHLKKGYTRGKLDASFVGRRISDVLKNWIVSDEWWAPTITELVDFTLDKKLSVGIVIVLTPYTVGKPYSVPWVPFVSGNLLGMWPVSTILPRGTSILLVRG